MAAARSGTVRRTVPTVIAAGRSTEGLVVVRITTEAALASYAAEWDRLAATMRPRMPFAQPQWNMLWWRHLRRRRLACRDHLHSYAIRDDIGRLIAIAPMMLSERPSIGPVRVREMQFFGADANLTERRGPVCAPWDEPRVVRALATAINSDNHLWDWVHWQGLASSQPVEDVAGPATLLRPSRILHDYVVTLPGSWDALYAGLPRNIRESLRKCRNSLQRTGGALGRVARSATTARRHP